MDRIQNIESRFNSIEARFNPDAAQTKVPVGQEMQGQQSFSQVYQSMMQTGGGKVNYDQMQMGFNPSMSAAASSTGSENQYDQYINASAKKYGVDPNLIKGMIKQESGFNQNAVSHCGAQGLMQLMPDTARELGVQDAFNPAQNIDGGAKYIRKMLDMFDGDLKKAVAAYNAGPGNVQKHNGIPPIEETQNYVVKVLGNYSSYRSGG
jgi:soluble lytic murein transglycosylase-like protein